MTNATHTESDSDDCIKGHLTAIHHSDYQSRLRITPGLLFLLDRPKPNWWFRLWQRLLLGWTWEDVDE